MNYKSKPDATAQGMHEAPAPFISPVPQQNLNDTAESYVPIDYDHDFGNVSQDEDRARRTYNINTFTPEHAEDKNGPVIIPFGMQGSGKTTFLATLFKLMSEAPALRSEVIVPERDSVANFSGQAMLNEWNDLLSNGSFVNPTNTGEENIRDIEIQVTPLRGQRTPLRFSIVEVSGEDLYKVVVTEDHQPSLPKAVELLFTQRKIRPMLILMVHPERRENDKMFENLLLYLRQIMDTGRMDDMPLLVLIPNPARAMAELRSQRPDLQVHKELTPELCPEYLREFAPRTSAIFSRWPKKRRGIMPYYVGTIAKSANNTQETRLKITTYDDTHAKQVFKWIYKQFTGKELGQSWYSSFMKLFND